MPTPSRDNAISAYLPPFAAGAKCYGDNIASGVITSAHIADGTVVAADVKAGAITSAKLGSNAVVKSKIRCNQITGTILSANVVYKKAHGLGGTPSVVIITPVYAVDQAKNFTSGVVISESAASAVGAASAYVIGNRAGAKYKMFVMI